MALEFPFAAAFSNQLRAFRVRAVTTRVVEHWPLDRLMWGCVVRHLLVSCVEQSIKGLG